MKILNRFLFLSCLQFLALFLLTTDLHDDVALSWITVFATLVAAWTWSDISNE